MRDYTNFTPFEITGIDNVILAINENNNTVPEPITATLGLMGLGVLAMATRRRVA